ncbi:Platelet-activating factor acetylhydrolase [Liparis tanakae]|uniref:1-alkyl-2-acetylglycerophosphocholine esterase n=1 Tax=Liparis tanakae TaxID=230148 RepID=A0A4Z2F9V0_9TELE|nr:Platelet-activating factor acetylhydrolase [Liparis tanakae]
MGNACSNHLGIPPAKGPHAVGCTDFMMDHTAQGSFFRLYYPCQETENPVKPDWVPCVEYFNGLADFMKINRTLSERIFNYLFGSFKIPAAVDAPFKSDAKCPVVIFSHGLGAFRTLYSAICAEMASQGFIVASVEHSRERGRERHTELVLVVRSHKPTRTITERRLFLQRRVGCSCRAVLRRGGGARRSEEEQLQPEESPLLEPVLKPSVIDQSASATYFLREKTESKKADKTQPETSGAPRGHLVREWMYYRSLEHGEKEFPLRNQQVSSFCGAGDDSVTNVDRDIEFFPG